MLNRTLHAVRVDPGHSGHCLRGASEAVTLVLQVDRVEAQVAMQVQTDRDGIVVRKRDHRAALEVNGQKPALAIEIETRDHPVDQAAMAVRDAKQDQTVRDVTVDQKGDQDVALEVTDPRPDPLEIEIVMLVRPLADWAVTLDQTAHETADRKVLRVGLAVNEIETPVLRGQVGTVVRVEMPDQIIPAVPKRDRRVANALKVVGLKERCEIGDRTLDRVVQDVLVLLIVKPRSARVDLDLVLVREVGRGWIIIPKDAVQNALRAMDLDRDLVTTLARWPVDMNEGSADMGLTTVATDEVPPITSLRITGDILGRWHEDTNGALAGMGLITVVMGEVPSITLDRITGDILGRWLEDTNGALAGMGLITVVMGEVPSITLRRTTGDILGRWLEDTSTASADMVLITVVMDEVHSITLDRDTGGILVRWDEDTSTDLADMGLSTVDMDKDPSITLDRVTAILVRWREDMNAVSADMGHSMMARDMVPADTSRRLAMVTLDLGRRVWNEVGLLGHPKVDLAADPLAILARPRDMIGNPKVADDRNGPKDVATRRKPNVTM